MRLQRESCVYIVNLCREIVANYSRTSLQLSHSNEGLKQTEYPLVETLVCICPRNMTISDYDEGEVRRL